MLILSLLVIVAEAGAAFLALDLFFRYMPVEPGLLSKGFQPHARYYGGIAALLCVTGALLQWQSAGWPGLAAAACNWIPWWLLWRFGLRKQFTYLFKSDGGRPIDMKKPDP